jgi:hypothetical protein
VSAHYSIILLDFKGELADLFLRSIAQRLTQIPAAARQSFLDRLTVIRPFAGRFAPPLQILERIPGVSPLVQAHALTEIIEGAVSAPLGSNQSPSMSSTLAGAIEEGYDLLRYRYAMANPDGRIWTAIAERSQIPEVRAYLLTKFVREKSPVIDGITSRIDALLRVESLKASFAAEHMVDLRRAYSPGSVTILDFGGADLGAVGPRRASSAVGVKYVTWAAFDPNRSREGFTFIVADEIQSVLSSSISEDVARLITTGRSFGVGFLAAHQGETQLPSDLRSDLSTNIRLRILGRSCEKDAEAASEWLPRTGFVPKRWPFGGMPPDRPEFLSEREEERHWVRRITDLPRRVFLVADRGATFGPRFVETPTFDPPPWDAIDPEIADAVLRGNVARPREELLARARDIEERAVAELISAAQAEKEHRRRRESPVPRLPDVVGGSSAGRGARGGAL